MCWEGKWLEEEDWLGMENGLEKGNGLYSKRCSHLTTENVQAVKLHGIMFQSSFSYGHSY